MATGDKKKCEPQFGKISTEKSKLETTERLSAALRRNLHRRKEQARARKSIYTADIEANKNNKDGR